MRKWSFAFRVSGSSFLLIFTLFYTAFYMPYSAFAAEEWHFYRINAQYRGSVKKSFRNIGCALAWFNDTEPGKVQMIAHVCAVNPDRKNDVFAFRTNLTMGYNPNSVWILKEIYAEFKKITGQRQSDVKCLAGLWDYIRRISKEGGHVPGFMNVAGKIITLKDHIRRDSREVTCSWSGRRGFSGKFFLRRNSSLGWEIDKFRFKSGNVAISLIKDSVDSVSKDFRYKQPFAGIVFDNK